MNKGKTVVVSAFSQPAVTVPGPEIVQLFERALLSVRDDLQESPYIIEALRVLPVGGYRSAIGSFWNAVVDDLRNKVIARSLLLFNKSLTLSKEVKTYEDFQNHVNDDQLIEGAYKIGVIGWEASKMLRHAKETRHVFDGHPKSSEPSIIKVLSMMDDCVKYVLNVEYPAPIIDIDEYLTTMADPAFDRNAIAIENALAELPEIYKNELVNRMFTVYVKESTTTVLRSNIEFAVPILWRVLPKDVKVQVVRRIDHLVTKGNSSETELGFAFVRNVGATSYLSSSTRKYKLQPLVSRLKENLDQWTVEDETVRELAPYAAVVPPELLSDYVSALVHTYVGYTGSSGSYARTDFYANGAALAIPGMFQAFDDRAAEAFVECITTGKVLRDRIKRPAKLRRLRALANIVLEKASESFSNRAVLERIVDETQEAKLWELFPK